MVKIPKNWLLFNNLVDFNVIDIEYPIFPEDLLLIKAKRFGRHDFSTKLFEIQIKTHYYDADTREVTFFPPKWHHFKYYNTYEGALHALKTLRANNKTYRYSMCNKNNIRIYRFRVVGRVF